MDNSIKISLSERTAGLSEVRVDGVIDTLTASELEQVIDSLIKRDRFRVIVDLAGVDYISSAGWGIFISQIKHVRANDGDIKLANMSESVREIYELLEFENVLKAYDSIEAARSDFGTKAPSGGSKKKASVATKLTVIDQVEVASDSNSTNLYSSQEVEIGSDIGSMVVNHVLKDPFSTISEICQEINRKTSSGRIGWWKVFNLLRRHKLLSHRSRFKRSRRYYQK